MQAMKTKSWAMEHAVLMVLTMLLVVPQSLHAYLVIPFTDLETYLKHGKTIFIGEVLATDEPPISGNAIHRRMRILSVLAGKMQPGETIPVVVGSPLKAGGLYLIYSGSEKLDAKGELNAFTYEPGTVEIQLWGEVPRAEKDARISRFIGELHGRALKEKLLDILERRQSQLKSEEQSIKREQAILEKALKSK